MTVSVGMITVDTTDPLPLAQWWAEQTAGAIIAENEGFFVVVSLGEGSPRLAFQKVDDPTPGKNRMHLDLVTADRDAEVARLTAVGATLVAEHDLDGFRWVTLADPDGNLFCISGDHA